VFILIVFCVYVDSWLYLFLLLTNELEKIWKINKNYQS
jgi:hypothetical protein